MRARFGLWVLLGSPWLAACGTTDEHVSGQQFALTAQENLEQALRGVSRAGSFAADSAALAKMLEPVADGDSGDCVAVEPAPCVPGQVCPAPTPAACGSDDGEVTVGDLQETRDEINESIDELVEVLRERVFTPENLESEDATSATYLLGASFYCDESDDAVVPAPTPGGTPAPQVETGPDPDCIEQANRLQTRLRLSSPSDGNVDVELLISSERRNPATIELHRDHVGLVLDLGEYLAAVRATGQDTGEIVALDGVVAAELRRNAELDYSLRYGVRKNVHFASVGEDTGETTDVSLGASFPVVELRLDGNQRKLTGSYDLGTLGVTLPLENFHDDDDVSVGVNGELPAPEAPYTGTIDAFLAGIEGSVTLDGTNDELRLVNLGLGEQSSTVKYDGQLIAQLDVNPDQNRHFDVLAKKVDDEHTTLTFAPGLDARVLLNFAPLASQIPDLPDYLLGDTIRAFFSGDSPTIEPSHGQVKVVSGTLNVTSERVPSANLAVPAGSCLIDNEADDEPPSASAPIPTPSTPMPVPVTPAPTPEPAAPAHELLGRFSVGACQ